MRFFSCFLVGILFSLSSRGSPSVERRVWRVLEQTGSMSSSESYKTFVDLDFDSLKTGWDHSENRDGVKQRGPKGDRSVVVHFELPDGLILECTLGEDISAVNSNLKARLGGELETLAGKCTDGSIVKVNYLKNDPTSVRASFDDLSNGDAYYIDKASGEEDSGTTTYIIYRRSDMKKAQPNTPEHKFECGVSRELGESEDEQKASEDLQGAGNLRNRRRRLQNSGITAYKFRIAIVTTSQYSAFHGGTTLSVMNEIVAMLNRVNSVFIRELGVYFELIDNNDQLICLANQDCSARNRLSRRVETLSNNNNALYQATDFIARRGILPSAFDIGHVLTTSSGLAGYPVVCGDRKAEGTSGLSSPTNDPFWIDYVSHELGHQLQGAHSFRDCDGPGDTNAMLEGAVEPGSGSSIMGYAGICGARNLASNSDPYFNSNNLVTMRQRVRSVTSNAECGEVIEVSKEGPQVNFPLEQCSIPVGNYFVLEGDATGPSGADWAFGWDRLDNGYEAFADRNTPRFRSWKPTSSKARTFPNMYYLLFADLDSLYDEILPKSETTMNFRFIARTQYESLGTVSAFTSQLVGAFDYTDVKVDFVNVAPLSVAASLKDNNITTGEEMSIEWNSGATATLSANVKIEVANNTFEQSETFDYERDTKVLEWQSLGSFPNAGQATVVIPSIYNVGDELILRVRSENDGCFFFDFAKLSVQRVVEQERSSSIAVALTVGILVPALLLTALAVFLFIRHRRRNAEASVDPKAPASPTSLQNYKA